MTINKIVLKVVGGVLIAPLLTTILWGVLLAYMWWGSVGLGLEDDSAQIFGAITTLVSLMSSLFLISED